MPLIQVHRVIKDMFSKGDVDTKFQQLAMNTRRPKADYRG